MGEVYRARDPRLDRDVAIKVLPAGVAGDPERLRRFEQEAKAAGALNHPNITAIYDVGSVDGVLFVVHELLEGETLRERLLAGPLPARKVIEVGAQIARGLSAAHEKGIVHRDLKPENLFLTRDGQAKILDFGLAKLTQLEPPDPQDAEDATRTRQTSPGTIVGTVAYMSPEQVRGHAVDHRSDVFSFGLIVFEMLSGRRAFSRETAAETMTAILREEAPELAELSPDVAPGLARLVRHCLEKDPGQRFQSARDLAFDLEALSLESGSSRRASLAPRTKPRRSGLLLAAGVAWTVGVVALTTWLARGKQGQPSYHAMTFQRGTVRAARFLPDGASVVYSAAWNGGPEEVYTARVDNSGSQPLGIRGHVCGAMAGEALVLRSDATLVRVPLSGGGAPREIAQDVRSADIAGDGSRIACVRHKGASDTLEYPLGNVVYSTPGQITSVRISRDATKLAIMERPNAGIQQAQVSVILAGQRRSLTPAEIVSEDVVWAPSGSEIWYWTALPEGLELRSVPLSGPERLVLRSTQTPTPLDLLADGRALISFDTATKEIWALGPGATSQRELSWLIEPEATDISEDGRRIVFNAVFASNTNASVFVRGTDGQPPVHLGEGLAASISPDGRWVLALTHGLHELTLLPTGAGALRALAPGAIRDYFDARWLPGSTRILIAGSEAGRPRRLFLQEFSSGAPQPVTPEGISSDYPTPSPDGQWVAAGTDFHSQPYSIYPLAGGEPRKIPGLAAGELPLRFNADGSALYVLGNPEDVRARTFRLDLRSGHRQPLHTIEPGDSAGVVAIDYVYLTPDGSSYVYYFHRELSQLTVVKGLR